MDREHDTTSVRLRRCHQRLADLVVEQLIVSGIRGGEPVDLAGEGELQLIGIECDRRLDGYRSPLADERGCVRRADEVSGHVRHACCSNDVCDAASLRGGGQHHGAVVDADSPCLLYREPIDGVVADITYCGGLHRLRVVDFDVSGIEPDGLDNRWSRRVSCPSELGVVWRARGLPE